MNGDPLEQVIQADYASMLVQQKAEQHKAVVIFAGSIVEAVLMFVLKKVSSPAEGSRIENLRLVDLIKGAKTQGILTDTTYKASDALRDSRNLVHPVRVARDRLSADRGLAQIAVGVVDKVCSEVAKWCQKTP
jgi:hypothetical protein